MYLPGCTGLLPLMTRPIAAFLYAMIYCTKLILKNSFYFLWNSLYKMWNIVRNSYF